MNYQVENNSNAPLNYGAPPVYLPFADPADQKKYSPMQKLLAVSCLILGFFYTKAFLFSEAYLGKTLFTLLLLAVSFGYIISCKRKIPMTAMISALLCAALSFGFILSDLGIIQFICAVFCQLSYTYFVYKAYDSSIEKAPSNLFDLDLVKAVLIFPFASFGEVFPSSFSKQKELKFTKNIRNVLIGLIISIIPTAIIVSLLSFDEGFEKIIKSIFRTDGFDFDVGGTVLSLIFGIPVAMYIFGLWYSSEKNLIKDMNTETCTSFRRKLRFAPASMSAAAIFPILAVYVIFFVSQFSYFTSAFGGILPDTFSYSEYARSGFFDLCTVTFINSFLIAVIYLFTKKNKNGVISKLLISLLSLFTVFLVAIAASKMILYVRYFGLTLKRVYTLWFMLTVALICLALILKMIIKKFPVTPVILLTAVLMLSVIVFPNTAKIVSNYNTSAVLNGENYTLDVEYFEQLGVAAIPDAVSICENEEIVNVSTLHSAKAFLKEKTYLLEEDRTIWNFNFSRHKAIKALREYSEKLSKAQTIKSDN